MKKTSATLIKPPPVDPSKSAIENVLELTTLRDIGPDIFTNTRPLWHPPGARGVYGGAVIAQSLAAAQLTVPPPSPANGNAVYLVHSMHCYFVLAGDASIPILYHVERVREGKSFMTRTVQARQRGKCIFTTTASFVREGSGGSMTVDHEWGLPEGVREALEKGLGNEEDEAVRAEKESNGEEGSGPFESRRIGILNSDSSEIQTKRTRQWIRARGRITPSSGPQAHLSALAYMSDSYFVGTIARVHNLWRFGSRPATAPNPPTEHSPLPPGAPIFPHGPEPSSSSAPSPSAPTPRKPAQAPSNVASDSTKPTHPLALLESIENAATPAHRRIGMMVSLDHTIYFHRPRALKADEWLFTEMESPWAGDGRGLVFQRIWNREGVLIASCVQEGLVRLEQDEGAGRGQGVVGGGGSGGDGVVGRESKL